MAVVGFDIGFLTSYVAIARQGGIETIANEYSDRCNPSFVSFTSANRFIGHEAKQQQGTNPKNTVFGVTRLLGKMFDDPVVQKEQCNFPFQLIKVENDGRVGIEVNYLNNNVALSAEQVYAMQLTKLKKVAEANLNTKVVDVVLNVPNYYTDCERRAIVDASQIAGLHCLKVINDTTAAGLAYGIYTKDLPEPEAKPMHVAFVNVGHCHTQAAIFAMHKNKMTTVASAADAVGGRDFDQCIFEEAAKHFLSTFKIDVKSAVKPTIRLLTECEKLKKLMSANSTEIPINIECFMDDKDVSFRMKRDDFEIVSAPVLKRIEAVLQRVLAESKMAPGDIASVEICGGSIRVPAIKRLISTVFMQEPRTSLNADEAVARGCAVQCAIISPVFRVREFAIQDMCPYSISLRYTDPTGLTNMEVFPHGYAMPSSRQLTFLRKEPFQLEAYYTDASQLPNSQSVIGQFLIDGVTPTPEGEVSKVKVKVRLNQNGVFSCSQAQIVEKVEKQVEVDVTPEKPSSTTTKAPTADAGNNEPMETTENSASNAQPQPPSAATPDDATTANDPASPPPPHSAEPQQVNGDTTAQEPMETTSAPAQPAKKMVMKTVNKYVDLPMRSTIFQLPNTLLQSYIEVEKKMEQHDRHEKERSSAKNSLEEYVYDMRDKIFGSYESYLTETDREQFSATLSSTEDWLYEEEGENAEKAIYEARLASLRTGFGDKLVHRAKEADLRPGALEDLGRLIVQTRKALDMYKAGDEQYQHWDAVDVEILEKALAEKDQWLAAKVAAQNALKPFQDPAVTAAEVQQQRRDLDKITSPIVNKPKPKVDPPPKADGETSSTVPPSSESNGTPMDSADVNAPSDDAKSGPGTKKAEDMDLD